MRTEYLDKASEMFWPFFGENAELKSLAYHAGLRSTLSECLPPSDQECQFLITSMKRKLSFLSWKIRPDLFSRDHFMEVISGVDNNSSPGYPHCLMYPNNGQLLGFDGSDYKQERLDLLYESSMAYVSGALPADPIRLFIKPEPTSRSKMEDERYRLISSVSIKERVVDGMLFGEFNNRVVETWPESPIKIGWSPVGGGWKMMSYIPQHAADRSSWDWTVPGWLLQLCLDVRVALCENMDQEWFRVASLRYKDLFLSPWFITSGGLWLKQKEPGVQKSGCFNTIVDNSMMQLLLHELICMRLKLDPGVLITVGDDTLQTPQPKKYYDELSKFCKLKPVEFCTEFCGFRFLNGGICEPVHKAKHAFSLKHLEEKHKKEFAESYSVVYHRSADRDEINGYLSTVGCDPLPKWHLDYIWDADS